MAKILFSGFVGLLDEITDEVIFDYEEISYIQEAENNIENNQLLTNINMHRVITTVYEHKLLIEGKLFMLGDRKTITDVMSGYAGFILK